MKKHISLLLVLWLLAMQTPSVAAGPKIGPGPITFNSVTFAGVKFKVATVDGGAMLTQCSGINFDGFKGCKITVVDAATGTAIGYIGNIGSGETYSATERLVNGGFASDTSSWAGTSCTLASVAGGQSGNCLQVTRTGGTNQYAKQSPADFTVGALYAYSGYVKSGTSGNETGALYVRNSADTQTIVSSIATTSASWSLRSLFWTATETTQTFRAQKTSATNGTMLFDSLSSVRVLTPDISGCTIVTASGGATQSWLSNTGINPNSTSFTVTVEMP